MATGFHGGVIPVAGGWVLLSNSDITRHRASGEAAGRVIHGFLGGSERAASPDGRHVALVDGSYSVNVFDLVAQRYLWQHRIGERASLAVAAGGVVFAATSKQVHRFSGPR